MKHWRVHPPVVLGLVGIGVWFWWGCLGEFFFQDDFLFLEKAVADSGSVGSLLESLVEVGAVDDNFRPLSTTLFYGMMVRLAGLDPMPYHAVNMGIHILVGILVYALAWRWTRSVVLAGGAGLVWISRASAFVPVHWSCGIQELLAGLGAFSYLLLLDRDLERGRPLSSATLSVLFLALLAKEVSIGLVLLAPLLRWGGRGIRDSASPPGLRESLKDTKPLLLVTWVYLILRVGVTRDHGTVYSFDLLGILSPNLWRWISWTVDGTRALGNTGLVMGVGAFAAAGALAVRRGRRLPLVLLLGGLVMAAPTILLGERFFQYYVYIPGGFLILALTVGLAELDRERPSNPSTTWILSVGVALVVAITLVREYRTCRRRSGTRFRAQTMASGKWAHNEDPTFVAAGGAWDMAHRHRVAALHADLSDRLDQDALTDTTVILVGWKECYLSSSIGGSRLTYRSPTESMLRLYFARGGLTLRIVDPFSIYALDYLLDPRELGRLLQRAPRRRVFFIDPVKGRVMEAPGGASRDAAGMMLAIRSHYARFENPEVTRGFWRVY